MHTFPYTYFFPFLSPPYLHRKQVADLGISLLSNVTSFHVFSSSIVDTKVMSVLLV